MQHYARMANEHSWYLIMEMLGYEHLGSGAFRDVYAIDDKWVVKIAKIDKEGSRIEGVMANTSEFNTWSCVQEGSYYQRIREWLAPIREMTSDGVALIQARTYPAKENQLPATLPRWSMDRKPSNGGILNGRFVFHDYQWTLSINDMTRNHKLVKAKWWVN